LIAILGCVLSKTGGRAARSNEEGTLMAFKDMLHNGFKRVGKEAKVALDKGKLKVEEMQLEMQLDGLAKKLGHLAFDAHRGRQVDDALRVKYLDDMTKVEEQIAKLKAEAAAKAEAEAAAKAAAAQAPKDGGDPPAAS
jgi:hypothetical protein